MEVHYTVVDNHISPYNQSMLTAVTLIAGFVFLIKGADLLVNGASAIAQRFNISDLLIGLTIVAFGTSAPELFVNLTAAWKGTTDIAIGNILGSNIANILLVLGIGAVINPLTVKRSTLWREIPLSLLAAVVIGIMANDAFFSTAPASVLSRTDGVLLLAIFFSFLIYSFSSSQRITPAENVIRKQSCSTKRSLIVCVIGITGLTLGGKWIVDSAIVIAQTFGVSEALIALTVIAVGTSLPEVATSAVAAYRKNSDIAVGNVVGSNIFNIFWVLGISSVIRPIPIKANINIDVFVMVGASILLFAVIFTGGKRRLDRWKGGLFLALYAAYLVFRVLIARTA